MWAGSPWKSENTLLKNPVDIWGSSSQPALDLNFVNGRAFDSRITFSRTTTATYFNQAGLLATAAINEPRIDYDPVTHESKGFLVEAAGTNLLTYSEQFDNAAWTKAKTTITANAITAPDGTLTADKFVEDNTSGLHQTYKLVTLTAVSYTFSVFAKAGERSNIKLSLAATGTNGAFFNLSTGAVGTVDAGYSAAIQSVGNGWYRCSVSVLATAVGWYSTVLLANTPTTSNYAGDGVSGAYIWGAQLETNSVATSYIPTVAATVTRALDSAVMTGTNFSDWYNPTEWTMVCEAEGRNRIGVDACPWAISEPSPTVSSLYLTQFYSNTSRNRVLGYSSSALTCDIYPAVTYTAGELIKSALGYAVNNVSIAEGGLLRGSDSTFAGLAGITKLGIGDRFGTLAINGHIKRLTYYNKRVSNTELQALSS